MGSHLGFERNFCHADGQICTWRCQVSHKSLLAQPCISHLLAQVIGSNNDWGQDPKIALSRDKSSFKISVILTFKPLSSKRFLGKRVSAEEKKPGEAGQRVRN